MKKGLLGITLLGSALLIGGTYTSMSINSDSFMNDNEIKFVKRLDELKGRVIRSVASVKPFSFFPESLESSELKTQSVTSVKPFNFYNGNSTVATKRGQAVIENGIGAVDQNKAKAVITKELDLVLTEVYSPRKYNVPLTKAQFDGSLKANNGIIENLEVSLPNQEAFNLSNVEMNGNMFSYEMAGEKYQGMIFTTDNKSFMVSLTEGPMDGTRFKFDAVNATQEEVLIVNDNQNVVDNNAQNIDVNPADPSFNQAQPAVAQPVVTNEDQNQVVANNDFNNDGAQYSEVEVEEQVQTQGFNFAAPQAPMQNAQNQNVELENQDA